MKAVLNNVESLLVELSKTTNFPKLDKKVLETFFTQIVREVGEVSVATINGMRHTGYQEEVEVRISFSDEIVGHAKDLREHIRRTEHSSFMRESNEAEILLNYVPEIQEFIAIAFGIKEVYSYVQMYQHQTRDMGVSFQVNLQNLPTYLATYRRNLLLQIAADEAEERLSRVLTYVEKTIPTTLHKALDVLGTLEGKVDKLGIGLDQIAEQQVATKVEPVKEASKKSKRTNNKRDTPMSQRGKPDETNTEA